MSEFRVGVVGYGWAAGAHIKSFNEIPGCEVRAVCSRRKLDPAALSREHGSDIRVYNDYAEMLANPELNVISICTPHPYHPDQVVAAAKAKKHLVIEKPVALTLKDLVRVEKAISQAGVQALICFEVRVIGHFKAVRDFIDRGLLGEIHYAEVDYYHGIGPWYGQYAWNIKKEFGGSSLLTAGCHAMDGLLWFMGSKPVEVMSYGTQSKNPAFQKYEYQTTTTTILKFENGAVGKCASSIDCMQPYLFNVNLLGSKGTIWNDKFYTTEIAGLDKSGWSRLHAKLADSGDVAHHPYRELFQDFLTALREGRPPKFDYREMLYTHRVCLAADHSRETGKPVKMSQFE